MSVSFLLSVVALIAIYGTIVVALDLQFSYGNLVNLGIVAYVAAGAYAYAIVTQAAPGPYDDNQFGFGMPVVVGLLAAAVAGGVLGILTAGPTLRMRGEYLALMTFAFAEVFHVFLENGRFLTSGLVGLPNVVRPFSDASPEQQGWLFAGMTLALLAFAYLLVRRVVTSGFGRLLLAVSDDEQGIAAVGKNVRVVRLQTFLIGSVLLSLAGAFFVMYVSIATPTIFLPEVTFVAWIALVVGGVRTRFGALLGAAILIGLQEGLRLLSLSPDQAATVSSLRVMGTGLLLIVLLRLRPPEHVLSRGAGRRRAAKAAAEPAKPVEQVAG
jgi:branched-chain amino acid transport system permease protein